ncbi:alpha/beta fold hydrolase [Homoserinibacter sp. YIM 151385]|uniref:alpha/beta fold hydrolase n=1 Tax=Homoserinibacter sp. YIM 151385 TaxID=2985506 RepID=UPI0022F127DF|nr:alpha/beta hydrolase [Homoserinibacter sp. YIM 151385]WBU38100.1 alpha/beta hydrolase [Homoserinibacter sp. YIM 151385]
MIDPEPYLVRRGRGTPLLFVHGNGVDHRVHLELDELFEELGGWERIHVDLPGFGRTPALGEPGGLPELADWLAAALPELVGDAEYAVLGSSLGGLLARDLVARDPGRCLGMALLVPVVDAVRARRTLPPPVVLRADPELLASLDPEDAAEYAEMAVEQSREGWERFARAVLPGVRAADEGAMRRLGEHYELAPLPDAGWGGFARPVLIVAGRQDAVVGFEDQERVASMFPAARLAVLDRAGHNIHLDQPERVRALLAEWADRIRTGRPGPSTTP